MYAYNQPIGSQEQTEHAGEIYSTGIKELPSETRGLHESLYDNSKKAKLGIAQGCPCSSDE